jgi:hypothetical protein
MKCCAFLLGLAAATTFVLPAPAGILFNRQPKSNPVERVSQLLATLRADKAERRREAAARDLRAFDAAASPELVPALIEALQHDASADVRLEAAQTLGRLRPVTQQAAWALEEAVARDASLRVRLQARSLLLQYRLSGYRSQGQAEEPAAGPRTQPGASAPTPLPAPAAAVTRSRKRAPIVVPRETAPPPLASPEGMIPGPRAVPLSSPTPPLVPSAPPRLETPPSPEVQGPDLTPPR